MRAAELETENRRGEMAKRRCMEVRRGTGVSLCVCVCLCLAQGGERSSVCPRELSRTV